jgi:ankyrin repeat protein
MKKAILCLFGLSFMAVGCATLSDLPPIHKAINDNDFALVQQLVEAEDVVNARLVGRYGPTGLYPLELALEQKKYDIALYLLENGAEVTRNTFRYANNDGRYDIVKMLVEKGGIDVNQDMSILSGVFRDEALSLDEKIDIATDIAGQQFTNPSILLYVGSSDYKTAADLLQLNLSDTLDDLGRGILHVAAARANYDLVHFLIEDGTTINSLDNNEHTALFYAITVFGPDIDWHEPLIEDEKTAKIKFISDMPFFSDPRGLQQRQVSVVMALLDAEININQQNKWGWTVLHFASAAYPAGLQELLLSRGADKNLKTAMGRTAADILTLRQ